jgi:FAD:protein FMN transferase
MTATPAVTDPRRLDPAIELPKDELAAMALACSRFRADSEINLIQRTAGSEQSISPLLNEAIGAALRVARTTGSLDDPTVGTAVVALRYDQDYTELAAQPSNLGAPHPPIGPPARDAALATGPAPGAWRIGHDSSRRTLTVPAGVAIDLGATAKALAAHHAAHACRHSSLTCPQVTDGLRGWFHQSVLRGSSDPAGCVQHGRSLSLQSSVPGGSAQIGSLSSTSPGLRPTVN